VPWVHYGAVPASLTTMTLALPPSLLAAVRSLDLQVLSPDPDLRLQSPRPTSPQGPSGCWLLAAYCAVIFETGRLGQ
jgi:hypothetical protein